MAKLTEAQRGIITTIRDFVNKEVIPTAKELEQSDIYPTELVERMKEFGLFGAIIPEEYGGLGLDYSTYSLIIEELCRGWMSLSGALNSHLIMAYIVNLAGTDEQKKRYLPRFASGELRGGIAITEPNAGSDVAAIQTRAAKQNGHYIINGNKMFITNGYYGGILLVVAKTNPDAQPPHRGISNFLCEKGEGFVASRKMPKLGYRGLDTAEISFTDYKVSAENLVGLEEGKGFYQIMDGLEVGRINVAARAVGVARAALEAAIQYSQQRQTFGKPIAQHQAVQLKLADMATQVRAAHLLTMYAAEKKDSGKRCDLEAGMAKLFASEICLQVSTESMRIHGGYGYIQDLPVERYYRDSPLMIIGEGTNEILKTVIAKQMLKQYPSGDFIYEEAL